MLDRSISHFENKRVLYVRDAKTLVLGDLSVSNYLVQTTKSRATYHGFMPTILRYAKGLMVLMISGSLSVMAVSWPQ